MTTVERRTSAHVLLQADPGRAAEVAAHLAALPDVATCVTSGPFDVIAQVPAGVDLEHVVAHARRAPGLARLCLCRTA